MKTLFTTSLLVLFSSVAFAQESSELPANPSESQQITAPAATYADAYSTNLKMREERRVGVGTQAGGTTGLIGLHMELNIQDEDAAWAGFGVGSGYSTFSVAWKHHFEGEYLTPYTTVGWSRWYNSTDNRHPDSYLLDATLTGDEKETGRFGVDYLVAGGGVQYNQLDGDFAGASFFAELEVLAPPFRAGILPSASVGVTYFF